MLKFKKSSFILLACLVLSSIVNAQTIKATNAWKSNDYKSTINVEDDLLIHMDLGKTMMEAATERGLDATGNLYGMFKIKYGDSEKIAGPFMFMSMTTMTTKDIHFVMNVKLDDFKKVLNEKKGEMGMGDVAMLTLMGQTNSTQRTWISHLAGSATPGQDKDVKVDFYFVKDVKSKAPVGKIAASGSFKCKVTKEGLDKLYSSGRIPERFKPTPDDGVTHDLHKKYLNKVAFSTKSIDAKETSDANFKTAFSSLTGGIYGRAYLPKSVRNYGVVEGKPDQCYISMNFYVGKDMIGNSKIASMSKDVCAKQTTFDFVLAPSSSKEQNKAVTAFADALKNVKEGNQKIVVDLTFDFLSDDGEYSSVVLAKSEFDLTASKSDRASFIDKYGTKYAAYTGGGGSGSAGEGRISYYIENKTGATIGYSYMGSGMSGQGSVYNNSKTHVVSPAGYFLQINGRDYRKISKNDNGKTIVIQ